MVRNRFHIFTLAAALAAGAGFCAASTIIGALEDTPGSAGYEKNGDFNDMMFQLTGNITLDAPGGVFNNFSAAVVNQNGTVFWDNPSLDGPDKNVGYMLLADTSLPSLQYLAMPGGGSANNVTFDATGTVTLTYMGGIAADTQDMVGWYSLADPGVLNPLVGYTAATGDSVTFNPDGAFALYASDGNGQTYSSIAASNIGESGSQQHFAFFDEPGCQPPQVPEPSSATMAGIGVVLLGAGLVARRRRPKRGSKRD